MQHPVPTPFEPPPCPKCDSSKRVTIFLTLDAGLDRSAPDWWKVTGYRCDPCGLDWSP